MNKSCFEIGTIQAFLDGELPPELSAKVTNHVAACDTCALVLAEAEEENSFVFAALDRELDSLVPTQRLWSRINETITVQKSQTPFWQRFLAVVSASLANPSFAAAAGILIVVGMFVVVMTRQDVNEGSGDIAFVAQPPASESRAVETVPITTTGGEMTIPSGPGVQLVTEGKLSPKKLEDLVVKANMRGVDNRVRPQYAVIKETVETIGYLPGEESYVKTIADLKQNVDAQKDTILTPSTRVSYERDMAVVDDSIKKMRDVVRKNPRNQGARQVLYSSYQDKIDLLNSVAQREELLVSLR